MPYFRFVIILLVGYIFLDTEERSLMSQSNHDYLIEQLYYTPSTVLDNINCSPKVISEHPCKLLIWVIQLAGMEKTNDR